jgi:hypothetical protein
LCKKAGITIAATSKDVCKALEDFDYQGGDDTMSGVPVRMYTPEAFMDAIVRWIIADDQVSVWYSI